jgi:hypothetical protein
MRLPVRALAAACFGAAAGAAALTISTIAQADLTLEFDREPPAFASGFYAVERHRDETFAWTSKEASLALPGLDRRPAWTCVLRLRGARPAGVAQPDVSLSIDGVAVSRAMATPDYADVELVAPSRGARRGLRLTIVSDPTFVPSASDTRELGVQMDRVSCAPAAWTLPPWGALGVAAVSGAALGIAFSWLSVSALWPSLVALAVLAAWQSIALAVDGAMYTAYARSAMWLAAGASAAMMIVVKAIDARRGLASAARFAIGFSVAAAYVKLLALFHPSKPIVDAVFHARRLDWVLDGRFYFTQPMPDGVAFPYAIGLYLFAAPWSLLTDDHVALLRIVVVACEAVAGALLYSMIVRAWQDRAAGALAVALFHLVPVPYAVIGNANLTNAFGQSAALVTVALAVVLAFRGAWRAHVMALTLAATFAFLSHVSIVSMLAVTLAGIGALYWWKGGQPLRSAARGVLIAAVAAAVLSVVVYYGHFGEVYRTLARVRTQAGVTAAEAPAAPAAPRTSIARRAAMTAGITVSDVGWPILLLAGIGLLRVRATRAAGDRLMLVIGALGLTYLAFAAFATVVPVGVRFERYAAEFVGRVDFATYPAAVMLAAAGAAWLFRGSAVMRVVALVLIGLAAAGAAGEWYSWIH